MTDRTVRVVLEAVVSQYRNAMRGAAKDTADLDKQVKQSTDKTNQSLRTLGTGLIVGGGALLAGFGAAVSASARFEKQMSGVKAVANATAGEMKQLSDAALKAGADTVFSASDAAKAESELAKAGISVKDILGGALVGSLSLAAAGQLDLADAATVSAQAMNVFKLKGSDVGHIADVLAAAANKSAADVKTLGDGLRQGGLVAAQTGLSLEETTGALAAFADNALVGSDAGTSLKTMLQRLTPQSAEAQKAMDDLGISAYDSQGRFIGLAKFAGSLRKGLSGLTDQQKNSTLATIFGSDAVRAASILYDQGEKGIQDYVDSVNDQGAAARMAATQMDNLSGDVEALKGSLETNLIRSGSGANKVLREMTQAATGVVNAFGRLPQPVQEGVTGIGALAGVVGVLAGGAMIGVTQVSKFKDSLTNLGVSANTTSRLVGAAGKAMKGLGIAGVVVGGVVALDAALESLTRHAKLGELGKDLVDFATDGVNSGELVRTFGNDFEDLGSKIGRARQSLLKAPLLGSVFGGASQGEIRQARADIDALDQALSTLVQNGAADIAAADWKQMTAAAAAAGISQKELADTFPAYAEALANAHASQSIATHSTGSLTKALDKQTAAAQADAAAIKAQAAAVQASFDPLFAMQDALTKQTAARKALRDAVKAHGKSSKEAAQAEMDLLRATVDLDGAIAGLRSGLKDGSVSLTEVKARLDAYARAGLISTSQAKDFKRELSEVAKQAGILGGKLDVLGNKHPKPSVGLKDNASAAITALRKQLLWLEGRTVNTTVGVHIRTLNDLPLPTGAGTGATGGIVVGPGTSTSDNVPMWLSNGEYVVNAAATREHRAMLDFINGGGTMRAASTITSYGGTSVTQGGNSVTYGDINIYNPTPQPASDVTSTLSMIQFLHGS